MSKVLAAGDIHQPWACWPLWERIAKRIRQWRPEVLVQQGDFVDGKAWARFDRETDAPNPDREFELVEQSFEKLDKLLPKSLPKIIVPGNHDIRHMTAANGARIPSQLMRKLEDVLSRPGWKWHTTGEPLIIDGVAYIHGDEVDGTGITVCRQTGYPTVHGHIHSKAGVVYDETWDRSMWAMNVGTTWDRNSMAGRYSAKRVTKSWLGWGEIDNGLPRLMPWSIMKNR